MSDMVDVSPWNGLQLGHEITGGHRNQVWHGSIGHRPVAVRRSSRASPSLDWELDLIEFLDGHGFVVPTVVETYDGRRHVDGLVVQDWIPGEPPTSDAHWQQVANELQRLHALTTKYHQRPGCCTVPELETERRSGDADLDQMDPEAAACVLAVFATYKAAQTAVVHGDVWAPNLRITPDGAVGILDWDESRVDVTAHDLSPLPIRVLGAHAHANAQRLSHAWEAANGWTVEPDYARTRLAALDE